MGRQPDLRLKGLSHGHQCVHSYLPGSVGNACKQRALEQKQKRKASRARTRIPVAEQYEHSIAEQQAERSSKYTTSYGKQHAHLVGIAKVGDSQRCRHALDHGFLHATDRLHNVLRKRYKGLADWCWGGHLESTLGSGWLRNVGLCNVLRPLAPESRVPETGQLQTRPVSKA